MRVRVSILAGLAIGLPGISAVADDLRTAASKVAECREIADDTLRLSCLDSAALAVSIAIGGESTDTEIAVEPAPPEWAKAPERSTEKKQVAATDAAPDTKEDKLPIWARVMGSRDQPKEEKNVYTVSIARITRNNVGRHFFHTTDGQVWQQTVIEDIRPPKSLPAAADIEPRSFGNPTLRFSERDHHSYTVRRIE